MVTAEIAYEQLLATTPGILDQVAAILEEHPDRAPFEVAAGRTTGQERARRLFIESARWPDDARRSEYDHPNWHAAAWPVVSRVSPPPNPPDSNAPAFEAVQAFELNFKLLSDPSVSQSERAVALCWVLHLAGDIHQPLHSAQLFSATFPSGDRLGLNQYVRDASGKVVSLHWYWDDSVNQSDDNADVVRKASLLMKQFPRGSLEEMRTPASSKDFARWAREESYPLAVKYVYDPTLRYGSTQEQATAVPEEHARQVMQIADKRVALAGYRMADLLHEAFSR